MATLKETIQKVASIDRAIESALQIEVADAVKKALVESAYENVYNAYTPEFLSRRYGDGGIADEDNINVTASGNELTASDDAPWQQLWGGTVPSGRLAEAIAEGDPRYNMGNAGPRPFHESAKRQLIDSGEAERALRAGLARQGIDTSGMTFRFI